MPTALDYLKEAKEEELSRQKAEKKETSFADYLDMARKERLQEEDISSKAKAPKIPTGKPQDIITGLGLPTVDLLPEPEPVPPEIMTEAPFSLRAGASFFENPEYVKKFAEYQGYETRQGPLGLEIRRRGDEKFVSFDAEEFTAKDIVDFLGEVPEVAASIILEPLGYTYGGPVGGVAAAGGAQVVGKGARLGAQKLLMGETEEFNPLTEAGIGAGSEILSNMLFGGLGRAGKFIKKKALKPTLRESLDFANERGIRLSLADATQSPFWGKWQNAFDKLPFGGRGEKITREAVESFDKEVRDEFLSRFGKEIEKGEVGDVVGAGVVDSIKGMKDNAGEIYKTAYDTIEPKLSYKAVRGGLMALEPVLEKPRMALNATNSAAGDIEGLIKGTAIDDSGIMRFIGRIKNAKDMNMEEMAQLRSDVLSEVRNFTKNFGQRGKRWMLRINAALNQDIENYAKKYGKPETLGLWKEANKNYREAMEILNNDITGTLFDKVVHGKIASEEIIEKFVKPKQLTKTKDLKNVLSTDVWKKVKGYVANDILNSASTIARGAEENIISPAKLKKIVETYDKIGVLSEIFDPSEIKAIGNFTKLGSLLNTAEKVRFGGNPSGTAGNLLKASGVYAIADMFTGSPVAASLVFAGPIAGLVLQSKPIVRYLSEESEEKGVSFLTRAAARVAFLEILKNTVGKREKPVPTPEMRGL